MISKCRAVDVCHRLTIFCSAAVLLIGCSRTKNERAMDWSDPLDPVAITTDSVVSKSKPILLVIHEAGHGGWQFMDGADVTGKKPRVIPKDELLKIDPSIREVIDLPVDWEARRAAPTSPWIRKRR